VVRPERWCRSRLRGSGRSIAGWVAPSDSKGRVVPSPAERDSVSTDQFHVKRILRVEGSCRLVELRISTTLPGLLPPEWPRIDDLCIVETWEPTPTRTDHRGLQRLCRTDVGLLLESNRGNSTCGADTAWLDQITRPRRRWPDLEPERPSSLHEAQLRGTPFPVLETSSSVLVPRG
jgi:hypothetical protein